MTTAEWIIAVIMGLFVIGRMIYAAFYADLTEEDLEAMNDADEIERGGRI